MKRKILPVVLTLLLLLTACSAETLPEKSGTNSGNVPEAYPSPADNADTGEITEETEETPMNKINVSFNDSTYPATLADNSSAQAFADLLQESGGSLTVNMSDYGSFEKVGPLGTSLPRNDEQITTSAGDIILYQGNSITIYYAQNSWSFTRLGRLDDSSGLREALGSGDVAITFALAQ